MKLQEARKLIDEVDRQIVSLLNRRGKLSRRIGRIKMGAGLPVVDREREEIVLRRIVRENSGEIGDAAITSIYRGILNESRRIQSAVTSELAATGERSK